MRVVRIGGGGDYLDSPDISTGPDSIRLTAVRHGSGLSRTVSWRIDDREAVLEWTSEPLDGLFTVRTVDVPGPGHLEFCWCLSDRGSRVVVLEPSGVRCVLSGLAEPFPVRAGERVLLAARRDEAIVVVPVDSPRDEVAVSRRPGRVFCPSAAPDPQGGIVVAWEQEIPPACAILSRRLGPGLEPGPLLRLDEGEWTSHAPCAAALAGRGVLVAWHSPAPFADPQILVKDARIVLVSGGEILHPEPGHAPDPGEEPRGEDQGFEFPVPLPAGDGSIAVLGRGSHGFFLRRLGKRWGAPVRIDEPGWGCRGPSVRGARDSLGRLWVATRERDGLVVRLLDEIPAGAPAFARRSVRCTGGRMVEARRIDPERDRDGLATWFGDIHQHSAFSDGTGAPHEAYVRSRDLYGDSVAALADHESFIGKRTPAGEWRYLVDLARRFDEPGRLATLVAYEWTGRSSPGPGHKVVYHPAWAPLVGRDEASTGAALLEAIAPAGGIAVPHHVGWTGADEESHRPDLQPCFEIVSCHGAYERRDDPVIGFRDPAPGPFLLDLLQRGLRFGFVGGSDGHGLLWHHGVSRKRDSHRTGLVAVLAHALDRPSVFDALRRRRVYATSGVPMWIRVWVEGLPMGSDVEIDGGGIHVEAQVRAGAPLRRAALVLAGREMPIPVSGEALDWSGPVDVDPDRPGFVYLRIEREDAECGWSSPVFLSGRRARR